MRRTIIVDLDSESWPNLDCTVMLRELPLAVEEILTIFKNAPRRSARQSQYDVAMSDFEVQVTNILQHTMRQLIAAEKESQHGWQIVTEQTQGQEGHGRMEVGQTPQRVEDGKEGHQPKTGGRDRTVRSPKRKAVK